MRMCVKAQSVYLHQPSTEEEPVEALDPPESAPWMRSRGIPYSHRVLQPGPRGTSSSMAPNYRSLYHHRMRKSKPPSRYLLGTGDDVPSLVAMLLIYPRPS